MTNFNLAFVLVVFSLNTIYCENVTDTDIGPTINNGSTANIPVSTLPPVTSSIIPDPTSKTPPIPPNMTTTSTTNTPTTKPTATTTVTPVTTSATTVSPSTSTTVIPNTTTTTTTVSPSTSTPVPHKDRHFDGASFIGGIILAVGLMGIGFIAFKFYKARTERNYHTL